MARTKQRVLSDRLDSQQRAAVAHHASRRRASILKAAQISSQVVSHSGKDLGVRASQEFADEAATTEEDENDEQKHEVCSHTARS